MTRPRRPRTLSDSSSFAGFDDRYSPLILCGCAASCRVCGGYYAGRVYIIRSAANTIVQIWKNYRKVSDCLAAASDGIYFGWNQRPKMRPLSHSADIRATPKNRQKILRITS